MGFQQDLVTGFAQLLDAEGVGKWRPVGAYQAGETAITRRELASGLDRSIALSTYSVDDDPTLSDSVLGLQVVTRWEGADPAPADDLADSVYDALHGLAGVDLGTGVHVVQCLFRSGTTLGQDQSKRWRTSSNFYVTVHRPSSNRT